MAVKKGTVFKHIFLNWWERYYILDKRHEELEEQGEEIWSSFYIHFGKNKDRYVSYGLIEIVDSGKKQSKKMKCHYFNQSSRKLSKSEIEDLIKENDLFKKVYNNFI
jgi:hypothetical protein